MKNYDIFEDYLEKKNFNAARHRDGECIFFRLEETTDNGANVVLVVAFYDDSNAVDVEIYNVAKLMDESKEKEYLHLINEFNQNKRFAKLLLTPEKKVKLLYSFITEEPFTEDSAKNVFDSLVMLFRVAEEAYPKFMKLQWG